MTKEEMDRMKKIVADNPGIGRRSLAQKAKVTENKARAFLDGARTTEDAGVPAVVTGATSGFVLKDKPLLAQKPTDVWRGRFYALRRGMGYRIENLAREWCASEDTIKSKAKREGALRYTEDPEAVGQYIAIAVHPETPKGK